MAGPTFGGHGSGSFSGSTFTGTAKKTKKKGRSWYGGLKNAVHDVEDMAVGATVGTAKMVGSVAQDFSDAAHGSFRPRQGNKSQPFKRTAQIGKAVGQSYADFYGPLAHGDVEGFLNNIYEHPLQLPLDVATVASLGVGGAARIGLIPAKAGIRLELTMANGEKVLTKPLARGEMRAQLQALTAKAKNAEVKAGPYQRPAGMAAAKVQRTKLTRQSKNVQAQNASFNRELRKLRGKPDKVAAFLLGRFDRQGLNEYMALLRGEAAKNPKGPAAITLKLIENPRVQKRFDVPTPKVHAVLDEARGLGEKQKGLLNIDDATAEAARYRPARIAGGARLEDGEWKGGPSIEELKARGLDPIYFPDVDTVRHSGLSFDAGGGKGLPKAPGATRQNTGALMLAGQLIHDPAVLNKSWLQSVKFQHYKDTHASLVEMASEADHIPAGYQAIRELPSERVPHMDRTRGEFMKAIDDEGVFREDAPTLTTRSPDTAARIENGNYLVVPDKIVKQMTGEFTRQNEFIRIMNRYPLKVWRALVLGLRPAWLVNNVVGNTMMYMVHSARPEDLKALAGAFKEFATPKQHKAIDRILDKHFAGQTQGGFVASEFPSFNPEGIGRYGSRTQKTTAAIGRGMGAVASALPRIDKRWEQALRKAKVKAELKRHPGLQEKVEKMGREVSYLERLNESLEGLPTDVKMGGQQLNIGHSPEIRSIADQYMRDHGMDYKPPVRYAKVDEARAKKIANAYDEMLDINDPKATPEYRRKVEQSYRAFIDETKAQYDALVKDGYTFEFYPEGQDPYPLGPRQAIEDLKQNKHLYVFPSDEGFGMDMGVREAKGGTLDEVLQDMGADVRHYPRMIEADEQGLPRTYETEHAIRKAGSEKPIEFAFRAISEDEWRNAVKNGHLKSDGRMNLSPDEGTVAALEDPSFYLPGKLASSKPGKYQARIVKVRLTPGWRLDRDGYVKTGKEIPLDEVDMVSPMLEGTRETRLTRGGQEVPVMPNFQPVKGDRFKENVHPLLEDTGVRWNGKEVTANDMFRGVHDVFGHGKEGVGFRWDGEENAWRAHVAMYSDKAKPAMTSETRGQNSWVNFGPHGEKNRTASQADTVYAEQKAGIMPEWTQKEGAADRKYTDAEALDLVLQGDPDAVHAVYDRVNDALGDFDHMSPAERSTLRSLFPFYSWFKAISGISAKLVVEQPLKVNVFSNLGRIAIESSLEEQGIPRDEWPQSLMGMLGMHRDSDGRISGYSTAGVNPYMTVAQLGAFGAALASLQPGEAGRTLPGLNPLLTDLGSYVWGATPQGYEVHGVGTVETLPFSRLLKAFELTYGVDIPWISPASSNDPLYDHNIKDEGLRYLGVPYARVSPSAAKRTVADR